MGKEVTILADASSIIDYSIDGVHQPTSAQSHFALSDEEYIHFVRSTGRLSAIYNERSDDIYSLTFTAPEITVDVYRNLGHTYFNGNCYFYGDYFRNQKNTTINGNATFNTDIRNVTNAGVLTLNNCILNTDNATWSDYLGRGIADVAFTGTSAINITTSSNGKTLITARNLTGTISLDVDEDVSDGTTFLIEATNNQLVITDGEWAATPSTVGNVTTYTLAKVGPSKKQRLFYTIQNGVKKMRFLTDSNGKQRLLGGL